MPGLLVVRSTTGLRSQCVLPWCVLLAGAGGGVGLSILKLWVISDVSPGKEQLGVGQQGQGHGTEVMAGTERAKRVSILLSLCVLLLLGLLLPLGLPNQRKWGCGWHEAKLRSSTCKHGTDSSRFLEMGCWV